MARSCAPGKAFPALDGHLVSQEAAKLCPPVVRVQGSDPPVPRRSKECAETSPRISRAVKGTGLDSRGGGGEESWYRAGTPAPGGGVYAPGSGPWTAFRCPRSPRGWRRGRACLRGPPLVPTLSTANAPQPPRRHVGAKPMTGGTPWARIAFEPGFRFTPPGRARSCRSSGLTTTGLVVFGERGEIACLPHHGCRLEVVATAPTSHRQVNLLLPGQVIRFKRWFLFGDRVELPSGTTVGLWHLVGFKFAIGAASIRL
jgi:hypothetical protein